MNTWHKFTGEYEKQFYDLRFPNGTIYYGLWPNAGGFTIASEKRLFKRPRFVTARDNFEVKLSDVDTLGMPIDKSKQGDNT